MSMTYQYAGKTFEIDLEQDGTFSCFDHDLAVTAATPELVKEEIRKEFKKEASLKKVNVFYIDWHDGNERLVAGTSTLKNVGSFSHPQVFVSRTVKGRHGAGEVRQHKQKEVFLDTPENRKAFNEYLKARKIQNSAEKAAEKARRNIKYVKVLKEPQDAQNNC